MSGVVEKLHTIIKEMIPGLSPKNLVKSALRNLPLPRTIFVIAIGKAAWMMAKGAKEELKDRITGGIIVTKYSHSMGEIPPFQIVEAGHPLPDINSEKAARLVVETLKKSNLDVLLLLSGGASSVFELPQPGITLDEITEINRALINSGATIDEINTVRKHLSSVKGGRLAQTISPRRITTLILSDVIGDRIDTVGSGPTAEDSSTSRDAIGVLKRYSIPTKEHIINAISKETPKKLSNATNIIIGNVTMACELAEQIAKQKGYNTAILTTTLTGEAREIGKCVSSIAKELVTKDRPVNKPALLIMGGETTVSVKGTGKGGRNQELALSAAIEISNLDNVAIASFGTDGTDGPTDAAGGIVDGNTAKSILNRHISPIEYLENNDSYTALKSANALIKIGPTGTNLNDVIMVLALPQS